MSPEEHAAWLKVLIARLRGVATQVYHAPRINVDNALPRDVISDTIDELVSLERAYRELPALFEKLPKGTIQ
jgi:hypothetical protein